MIVNSGQAQENVKVSNEDTLSVVEHLDELTLLWDENSIELKTILSKYNDKSSIDILNAIKSSLGQYTRGLESSDDITMVSLRRES